MNYDGFIREEISVDVSLPNYFTPPLIKEGDRGTRGFKVTITDGGEPIEIPDEGTEIWFNCRNRSNPEKHGSNRGVVNADGTVNVDVPAVVMDVPGMVECDISIITSVQGSDEPSILKTTLFCLNCEAAANKNGTTTAAEDNILAKIVAGEINPPGGANYEHVVEVVGDDLDRADRNDTLYIHKVGTRVKGIVFVAGDAPPYQGCTQYRLRKSGSIEYRTGALNTTTDPYSYEWNYAATGNWKRLATLDDIPDIPEVVNPWKNKTYISHGDSITWQDGKDYGSGTHQGETARGYQTVLRELLELGTHTNMGVNGATLADRAGVSVSGVSTIKSIASYASYDLCTIAFGTNDFKQGVPLGTLGAATDTVFDTTTFYGAFREAVKYILTSSPTIRLVLMTPLQRDQHDYNVDTVNAAGLKLIDYVNAVKLIGKMYGLPVCDLYSNSGITELTLSAYTIDGLHPNDEGYKRMGEVLANTLTSGGNNDATDLDAYLSKYLKNGSFISSQDRSKPPLYVRDGVGSATLFLNKLIVSGSTIYYNTGRIADAPAIYRLQWAILNPSPIEVMELPTGGTTYFDASEDKCVYVPYLPGELIKYDQKVFKVNVKVTAKNKDYITYEYLFEEIDYYTKTEINNMIGDIGTALDTLNNNLAEV